MLPTDFNWLRQYSISRQTHSLGPGRRWKLLDSIQVEKRLDHCIVPPILTGCVHFHNASWHRMSVASEPK